MILVKILKNDTYDSEGKLPRIATEFSTGADVIATSDPKIVGISKEIRIGDGVNKIVYKSIDYIEYKTNLKLAIDDKNYDLLLLPNSRISKYALTLANSVPLIDNDYRGEILLRFRYNWQPADFIIHESEFYGILNISKIYQRNDVICQMKFTKKEKPVFILTDNLDATIRGEGGFGSTEKQSNVTPIVPDSIIEMMKKHKPTSNIPEKKYSDLIKERETKI